MCLTHLFSDSGAMMFLSGITLRVTKYYIHVKTMKQRTSQVKVLIRANRQKINTLCANLNLVARTSHLQDTLYHQSQQF
jgi:hypothetical protein